LSFHSKRLAHFSSIGVVDVPRTVRLVLTIFEAIYERGTAESRTQNVPLILTDDQVSARHRPDGRRPLLCLTDTGAVGAHHQKYQGPATIA
jgi:hypothetical protein